MPESVCRRCARELPSGALECDHCHTLVHADELRRLAAEAKAFEVPGQFLRAREQWLAGLKLLPPNSRQAEWIRDHVTTLASKASAEAPKPEKDWVRKFGPLGPIVILLMKGKSLLAIFKLQFLLSLVAFMGVYWAEFGAKFGIGFALLVLIHEMGHFIDVKRRGLPADMPVFLPGLGAYVRWQALGVSLETKAAVSLAGPLAGLVSALACAGLWWFTGNGLWAALARAGAWLNLLNLIPIWMLDGGQAVLAIDKRDRIVMLTVCLLLWVVFKENVLLLVALGAAFRLFTKDLPSNPSRMATAYFLIVLTSLGLVMRMMPGQGFGR